MLQFVGKKIRIRGSQCPPEGVYEVKDVAVGGYPYCIEWYITLVKLPEKWEFYIPEKRFMALCEPYDREKKRR
jgi:hypothetical protein